VPRKFTSYEPDQIDCNTMVSSIAADFGLVAEIETQYARDRVWAFVRCRQPATDGKGLVQVQAVASAPLRTAKSLYIYQYAALLDCWHQCDRGTLAAATRPVDRGWDGRPKTPERRRQV
jgi:hypothetical protein